MIKELSTISLRNPLEMSKNNEIFGGPSQVSSSLLPPNTLAFSDNERLLEILHECV